jgi:4-diphosphocytidyl-2C-methyl-D-erythritol kinase
MDEITLKALAKINLGLDVLGRRENGRLSWV